MRYVRTAFLVITLGMALKALAKEPESPVDSEENVADSVKVAKEGRLKFGALLQGWWALGKSEKTLNTFRLRRAELALNGYIVPRRFFFGVMIDPAKVLEPDTVKAVDAQGNEVKASRVQSAISVLQDFYVGVSTSVADISIGQFKIPVSYEGFHSSGELMLAERSLFSRGLGTITSSGDAYKKHFDELGAVTCAFGDKRDLGVKVEKRIGPVYYFVGLFNGQGANNLDVNNQKDLAIRIEVFPVKGLVLGAMSYFTLREGFKATPKAKDRFEADVRLDYKPVLFLAEYLYARDYNEKKNKMTSSQGAYGQMQAMLPFGFALAGRFGWMTLDMDSSTSKLWEAGGGVHYYLQGFNANLKLDYLFYQPNAPELNRTHEVIFAMQAKF